MKYLTFLLTALAIASSPAHCLAADNDLELDVTMELVDEDADSSADIINIIELPVQEMERQHLRQQIRQQQRLRQEHNTQTMGQGNQSPAAVRSEMDVQMREAQQEAEEAKRRSLSEPGQKKGR